MRRAESDLQVACVNWFRAAYPHLRMLLFAIPNGGKRSIATAARMKKEGVVSGVSDLFLSVPKGEWHGFYIEMKAGDNKMTGNQEVFFQYAKKWGYKCEVVNSFDKFVREVEFYLAS